MKPNPQPDGPDASLPSDRPRTQGDASRPQGPSLPHDRDQQAAATNPAPDPHIDRAARDLKQGQVDTDLRATPGLDAERRGGMVKGGEQGAGEQNPRSRR
ncbi:hypothetical protein ASC95_09425 [Pelomonas sp. Root1217]|uniref:hypothetical protein n=1 Tax=Pelomonas sp. Root1217 TaxID=1736430 RepID=UPI00070C71F7|nr:hypothetical protein [Pelomonas sp. Root1217]KQV52989.1 hypothetical protein ASC95_09425 [Pelomonas sp. Root1217]